MFKLLTGYGMFSDSWGFLLEERRFPDSTGDRRFVTNMTIETVKQGEYIKPSFTLDSDAVQELFNRLWQQGCRPQDGSGNSGHVAAIEYHLEDMRRLVLNGSKVVAPK